MCVVLYQGSYLALCCRSSVRMDKLGKTTQCIWWRRRVEVWERLNTFNTVSKKLFIWHECGLKVTSRPYIKQLDTEKVWLLTSGGGFADERDQLLFDLLEGVQVVHEEDVSVAGFAGDAHQLAVVGVSEADGEHDVAWWTGRRRGEKLHY